MALLELTRLGTQKIFERVLVDITVNVKPLWQCLMHRVRNKRDIFLSLWYGFISESLMSQAMLSISQDGISLFKIDSNHKAISHRICKVVSGFRLFQRSVHGSLAWKKLRKSRMTRVLCHLHPCSKLIHYS